MDATAVVTVSMAVVLITEILKTRWPTKGMLIAAITSVLGVALYLWSAPIFPPARTQAWDIFVGLISVFGAATGLYNLASRTLNRPPPPLATRPRDRPKLRLRRHRTPDAERPPGEPMIPGLAHVTYPPGEVTG